MTRTRQALAKTGSVIALGFVCLTACGQTTPGNAEQAPAGARAISVSSLASSRDAPVEDQFIECKNEKPNGITLRHFFIITNGAVKSYSQMQNYARDLCDAGQPDCGLGWQGDKIGYYFKNSNGALNQLLVDLDSMTLERALTTKASGIEISQFVCTSSPFPEGITID